MKRASTIIFSLVALWCKGADLQFSGNSLPVIGVTAEASTGLEKIYVINNITGVSISYPTTAPVTWKKFKESGGGFAEVIPNASFNGTTSTISGIEGNCGYIVEDGNRQYCFWIVDYKDYYFEINGITFPDAQDCGTSTLHFDTKCTPIKYYSITGVPKQLSREIKLTYDTQVWNADNLMYETPSTEKTLENLSERAEITAPLCNTTFTIRGDRFLTNWGNPCEFTSDTFIANSIDIQTTATQTERDNDNEKRSDSDALGGSAPAEISFEAFCSDAVEFMEWQFSKDPNFEEITIQMNEQQIDYTFKEEGTTYVRFIAANANGTCTAESETYQINIGESMLDCPNAFSPDASEGVNDEWKVSYKSLISFKCWIFNRYGKEIFHFENPSQGWDGKYKGKYVKPGVYFYVIEAVGSDGKKYTKKGDINILKGGNTNNNQSSTEE